MSPLILLTNDDGFFSPGLEALQASIQDLGDIYVVAPDREKSATSLCLTLHRPLRVQAIRPKVFAVDGTPADCLYLAVQKLLPCPPDLVLSGINRGPNLGRQDVAYSGTVAAALQASFLDLKALAISLLPDITGIYLFEAAAALMRPIVSHLLKNDFPAQVALNINIPPPPVKGIKIVPLGEKCYRPQIIENLDPRGKAYYWIGSGDPEVRHLAGTDIEAVRQGFISITPLRVDFTATAYLEPSFWEKLLPGFS